jgi:hypothetical protein
MNKNLLGLMAALLLASSHLVEAQQPKKIYRVGLLTLGFLRLDRSKLFEVACAILDTLRGGIW